MSDWKTPDEVRADDVAALAKLAAAAPLTTVPGGLRSPLLGAAFKRCWLRLANGWTVSISEDDTPPALCCLAAWRTGQDDLPYEELTLFDFGGGVDGHIRTDCRCWTFADVREALITVAAAGAPPT